MALIAPTSPARSANAITFDAAAGGGDEFLNDGKKLLLVKHTNGAGSAVTLTIPTEQTVDGLAVADRAVVIDPGEEHLLGPFPTSVYNDADGNVNLAWSAATDIELAVLAITT